jgi:O-acetylhomoserine (thiol)-lyase
MNKERGFATNQVHAGYETERTTGAFVPPIYQTAGYEFEDTADAAAQFELAKPGSIYTRLANPTVAVLEKRITALSGGVGTVCFASGMAALLAAIQNMAETGSEIISMSQIYGGSYTLLFDRFEKRYGIRVHKVDAEDLAAMKAAINEKTRCIYIETLGNPLINIPDIEGIAAIAHEAGLPLISDDTFATPYLLDSKKHGIDFTVHSMTKYIGGHGNSVGGSVTDLGTFSFKGNPRFAEFNEPDNSYHGLTYADLGQGGYMAKLRAGFLRDTGACLSPFNAFLFLMGLDTLNLRMERHCENTQKVAEFLQNHPAVAWVNYPGLPGNAYYERAQKYFPKGAGGILAIGVKGGLKETQKFIEALEIFRFVAHVSDVRSMVTHPASTTHSQLSPDDMVKEGIAPEMVRVSVGIEDLEDLLADLDQALKVSQE